jgi:hypothetical protein
LSELHALGVDLFLHQQGLDTTTPAGAEKAAADDRRSLSSLIEKLLTDYCREHGYLEDTPKKRR